MSLADIPREHRLWVCGLVKACGWRGTHEELVMKTDKRDSSVKHGHCPACGGRQFFIRDGRTEPGMMYLLYSVKWSKGDATWWRPDGAGYTTNLKAAGRFSREKALAEELSTHRENIAIPEWVALKLFVRAVVAIDDDANLKLLVPYLFPQNVQ